MSRLRFIAPLAAFALLLVVLIVGLVHAPNKDIIPSPLVGKAVPDFSIPNLVNGEQPIDSAGLKGHWSLVNVWGSWCGTCLEEHPTLLMIKQQGRVSIIGVDWDDAPQSAMSWLGQRGNPYAQVGVDPTGRMAIDWGVTAAPESFLVNPEGRIVYKEAGEITPQIWQNEFLARIDAASGNPAGGG